MPNVRRVVSAWLSVALSIALAGACGSDADGGPHAAANAGKSGGGAAGSKADSGSRAQDDAGLATGCDLSGIWVTAHVTTNTAVGATQLATNWDYHRFEQHGTRLRIVDSLDCGYVVRGTTDVALADATLEALAVKATNAVGVEGTFEPTSDGEGCTLEMDRTYTIRGANRAKFLDAVWRVGDAPKELSEFTLPKDEATGMEDWDDDGHEGITQLTGLGDRYTAQLDWYAFSGTLPLTAGGLGDGPIGGDGVISAAYDSMESVSEQTTLFLRSSSVPMSPGYGFMIRASEREIVTGGEHPELETCKNVQALAVKSFGDPPRP